MNTDGIDEQTLALMKTALELVCQVLADGQEPEVRRYIAERILTCAEGGDKTLSGLIEAGEVAATELCSTHGA